MPDSQEATGRVDERATDASRPDHAELAAAVDRLIDDERIACLWYLRPDYYPQTDEGRLRVCGALPQLVDAPPR